MRVRERAASGAACALALLLLAGCGEEEPDLVVPERAAGQVLIDEAGLLDEEAADALRRIEGGDVVGVVYETDQANAGEAHRAGGAVIDAWGVDAVVVAVAEPGGFESEDDDRRRFFGVRPDDPRALGGVAEEINDEIAPPLAAVNDWTGVFVAAAQRLDEALE